MHAHGTQVKGNEKEDHEVLPELPSAPEPFPETSRACGSVGPYVSRSPNLRALSRF